MVKVEVNLLDEEWEALADIAEITLRPIARQARWLIRCALVGRGFLQVEPEAEEECMKEAKK